MIPGARPLLATILVALALTGCGRGVDPATAVNEAQALIEAGKSGEARILLKNALARQADLPGAREVLARIALEEGDARAAGDELAAIDKAQLSPDAQVLKVRVALALGRVDEAQRALEAAQDGLAEPEHTLLRASVLSAQGATAESLALLRAAQQQRPQNGQVAVQIAGNLAAMGNLDGALAELDRYLASSSTDRVDALRARGGLKLRQGASEQAVADLRAALQSAPPNWPLGDRLATELVIADAMLAAGQMSAAREQIDRVAKTWPGMLGTEVLQASLALLEGRVAEAVDRLTPIVEATPENIRLRYLLVDALMRSGNIARATEVLEKSTAAESAESPARRALAALWMQQGRPDRVIALLGEGGGATLEQGAATDDLLATARLARARASQTITTLTRRLADNPGDPAVRAELAAAQVANGEPVAALSTLGPLPARGFTPALAAARMAALLAGTDEFGVNNLVGRLLDPSAGADVATLVAAADVAQQQHRVAVVSRLLDRAATLDGGNGEVQLRRASLAFDARRYDEAERQLRDLLQREPQRTGVSVALARVAEARGDVEGARRTLQDTVGRDAAALEPALMLAGVELRAGHADRAAGVLDALIDAQQGKSAAAAAANAAGLMLAGNLHPEGARARFRQAAEAEPGRAEYWFNLGRSQISLADQAAARESFVKSARLQPDALPAVTAAVRLSLQQRDLQVAGELAGELVRHLPDSAGAWVLLGDADLAGGRFEAARTAYARATALRPGAAAAIGELHARQRLGAPRPEAPLETWLAREPQDLSARRLLSEHYLAVGNARAAREHLEIMLRQSPGDVAALNNLAWLLRETDGARAEQLALQAHAIAPDNPSVADTLGMIHLTRGKPEAAVPLLASAAAALPRDPGVQYHYALALRGTGRNAEARALLSRVLEGHTEFAGRSEARRLLEEL